MEKQLRPQLRLFWIMALAVITVFVAVQPAQAASFTDTTSEEVLRLAEDGIITGYDSGEFRPGNDVTRGDAAIMMVRAKGLTGSDGASPFSDTAGHYAEAKIITAFNEGYITGRPDGTFGPGDPITRAEMAAILTRGFEYEATITQNFPDVPSGSWFHGYVTTLANGGIIQGDNSGRFGPDRNISRLHFSLMMARTLHEEFRPDFGEAESPDDEVEEPSIPGNLEAAPGDKARVIVATGNLNLRATPNTSQSPIGVLSNNTVVDVHGKSGNWAFVEHNGQLGYASMTFLDFDYANPPEPEPSPEVEPPSDLTTTYVGIVARTPTLNVRSGPGTDHARIGQLKEGDMVNYHGASGNWVEISKGSLRGYVSLSFLTTMERADIGSLRGKTVVVDAGHGGRDPGAIANGLREKDIVLDVSLRLEAQLQAAGANVVMTRRTDIYPTLDERVVIANNSRADIFISVHTNAAASTAARGSETFYNTVYWAGNSQRLAESLQTHMLRELNTVNRGVKTAGFRVIRYTTMPSALVELGFKTNAPEAERMKTPVFREQSADALFKGTQEYFRTRS